MGTDEEARDGPRREDCKELDRLFRHILVVIATLHGPAWDLLPPAAD
jgi:hypothetical protein